MVTIVRVCRKQGRDICTKGLSGKHECMLVADHKSTGNGICGNDCYCRCGTYFTPWDGTYETSIGA